MPAGESDRAESIYQLKVTLLHVSPPIWRRIQVPGSFTLGQLHQLLQAVMGWQDSHLHQFVVDGVCYLDPDAGEELEGEDEGGVRLAGVLPAAKTKFRYEYDFGDSWEHEIVVEKIVPPEAGGVYPRVLAGRRTCPPEDCGGVDGYAHLLAVLADPSHPEFEESLLWAGGPIDPAAFDLERAQSRMEGYGAEDEDYEDDEFEFVQDEFYGGPALIVPGSYPEPVTRLLSLGAPDDEAARGENWLNYAALGLGAAHVPDLLRMACDVTFHWSDEDYEAHWAPLHAWRALGQLRAVEAVAPLMNLFQTLMFDDWADEDLPAVIGLIGPAALPALAVYLNEPAYTVMARVTVLDCLEYMAKQYPHSRQACLDMLVRQLERYLENDDELNAYIIWTLVNMQAREAAPVIERAFDAGAVAEGIVGDWQEVRGELGLKPEGTRRRRATQ